MRADTTISKAVEIRRKTLNDIRLAESKEELDRLVQEASQKLDDIVTATRAKRPVTGREICILDTAWTAKYHLRYEAMRRSWQLD